MTPPLYYCRNCGIVTVRTLHCGFFAEPLDPGTGGTPP